MKRREIIRSAVAVALATGLPVWRVLAQEPAKPLRLLVLGGTRFIGPHFVEQALAHGHQVTLFNRGKTNPGRVTDVEVLHGDRNGQLDALKGRQWDAVLDTSAFVPRIVKLSAELLAPSVSHYVYVSSISAYASFAQANDESSPTGKIADETIEKVDENTYGPQGAVRADGGAHHAGTRDRAETRPHRRSRRQYRSLHLLAGACSTRRRSHGARHARR
jgi:2'-hydroxyisoflavone reductase